MTTNEDLVFGIDAARNGDFETARKFLARAVIESPELVDGWLWLGNCLHDKEQRKYCYERVLRLDPHHPEAQKYLDGLFLETVIEQKEVSATTLEATGPTFEKKNGGLPNHLYLRILGIIAGLLVCGVPIIFLISAGLLDKSIINVFKQSTPEIIIPSLTYNLDSTHIETKTPEPTSTVDIYADAAQRIAEASNYLVRAESLMAEGKFAEAKPLLDLAIDTASEFDRPYYRRAICFVELSRNQRSIDEYLDYMNNALADIDKAIAIRPDNGDYYAHRHDVIQRLSVVQDYTVDRIYLNQIAYENMKTAVSLRPATYEYPERVLVLDLISIDHCEDAIEEVQKLIDKTPSDDPSLGGLLWIESEAYSCLGQSEKALKVIEDSMFNNINMEQKLWLKAVYLYNSGRYEEALTILNELIEKSPGYAGYRYYLRSLVYYKLGDSDSAEESLYTGAGNTWEHTGMYAYMQGNLLKDSGELNEAIYYYQIAEASLNGLFNPMRWDVQKELAALGAEPMNIERSTELIVTPIVTIQPRPTARPLLITPSPTPLPGTSTTMPEIKYPTNVGSAIIVDSEKGTGKVILLSGDYPLFRFQPAEPIKVRKVINIVVHLVSFTQTDKPLIHISLFSPQGGGWRIDQDPIWGDNPIEYPERHVFPDGDVFISVRNWGDSTVTIDNLILTVIVETEDGRLVTIGKR